MLFHLLVGVPSPVKDALETASNSTAENSFRCLRSVHVEIQNAFQYVPPLVQCALEAANTSARAVMDENLATLYLCFNEEFEKMEKQYECRVAKLEREIKSLKFVLAKLQQTDSEVSSKGQPRRVAELEREIESLKFVLAKQQQIDSEVLAKGRLKSVRRVPTKANKILQTQPDHDRITLSSPELVSVTNTHDATQKMNVEHHTANVILPTQQMMNPKCHEAKEIIPTQPTDQNAFAFAKFLSNRSTNMHETHHQALPSPQAKPGNNQGRGSHRTNESGSLDLIVKAMEQAGSHAGQSTRTKTSDAVDATHNEKNDNEMQPNSHKGETISKKSITRSRFAPRLKCVVPGCPKRRVQGGLCIAHGAVRKSCDFPGCTKYAKKQGKCSAHGPERKRCDEEGCNKVAVQGGRCVIHGARKRETL